MSLSLFIFPFLSAVYFRFSCFSVLLISSRWSHVSTSEASATYELCSNISTCGRKLLTAVLLSVSVRQYDKDVTGDSRCTKCGHPNLRAHNAVTLLQISVKLVACNRRRTLYAVQTRWLCNWGNWGNPMTKNYCRLLSTSIIIVDYYR
jgi:hypothetical protein